MPYCPRCGVETEVGIDRCPLCATPIILVEDELDFSGKSWPRDNVDEDHPVHVPFPVKRKITLEIVGLFLGLAGFIVLTVNWEISRTVSWAWYPVLSLVLAFLYTAIPLYFYARPVIMVASYVGTSIGFLMGIDAIDPPLDWTLPLGIPIVILLTVVVAGIVFAILRSKKKGFNIATFILVGIALFCVGLELIIQVFWFGAMRGPDWSFQVVWGVTPVVVLTAYAHHRITNFDRLKKFFHL